MRILITGGSGFIGTNLVAFLLQENIDFLNIDIKPPSEKKHIRFWKNVDIMDKQKLVAEFQSYSPTCVIHLAARTDTDSNVLADYFVNTEGTANVLDAIKTAGSVQRSVITSTQFVYKPGKLPNNDLDFDPHTTYGQSKVITENLTREAKLNSSWTIIRPTNVWGPWHSRYPFEFWKALRKGYYFHPGGKQVTRSYAYVGNVVYQIWMILTRPEHEINGKVFYVGDMPIQLIDWVNGFSMGITGKRARIIPGVFIQSLGYIGDLLSLVKIKFPITSARYSSMTQDYLTPMENTFKVLGNPPFSMDQGIAITVKWLEEEFKEQHK